MPTDIPRFESNERVDLTDFAFTVDEGPQALIRQLNEGFLTDPDGSIKSWILDGFSMVDFGAGQLRVLQGRAVLAQREGAQIHYGALTTEGDLFRTLDLSGYGNATYNVYLRFQFVDSDTQSRMFWNPSGPTEFAQTIQTRRQAGWSFRVELASPGNEWVQIGEVTIAAGVITTIKDLRNHYFEGVENSENLLGNWNWNGTTTIATTDTTQVAVNDWVRAVSDGQWFKITAETPNVDVTIENPHGYTIPNLGVTPSSWIATAEAPPYQSGWSTDGGGVANDRYADRLNYGVKDLQTFTAAVRQLFEDLRPTDGRWWEKRGLKATGRAGIAEPGMDGVGGSASGPGLNGTGGAPDGEGVVGVGDGSGSGVKGTGGTNGGLGVYGIGGAPNGRGTWGTGAGTGAGVQGQASGASNSSVGVRGDGDTSGAATTSNGVKGVGAGTAGIGVEGTGAGAGEGIKGTGAGAGQGVYGIGGGTSGTGVDGRGGAPNGKGVYALGDGTGQGVSAVGGDSSGEGVYGTGGTPNGIGVYGAGTGTGAGVHGKNEFSGHGVIAEGDATSPVASAFRIVPQDTEPTGPNAVGNLYVLSTNQKLYICTVAGTPGTWVVVGAQVA